jgi:hypothetical protein
MDPYYKVDYSHITPEATMVMKKASVGDSPLWQGTGKSFWTLPISRRRRWRLAVCFEENRSGLRFFPSRRIYRRKGGVRRWTSWSHPLVARPGPRPRHPRVWPGSGPLRLIFGLRDTSVKIGGSAFVSSNSENISCVAFLKYKNSRKQGTGNVASR